MRASFKAGHEFPPIVVERDTGRIIDGAHRFEMYRAEGVAEVECIEKTYRTEADAFLDCVRYNATHGRTLTSYDRTHCAIRAEELKILPAQLASAMAMTTDAVGALVATRVGKLRAATSAAGVLVPLKRTIQHMAGKSLTRAQEDVNGKLSGAAQSFYVNQIVMLIEQGLLNREDERLIAKLRRLRELLADL
jgi:hypothetical protein